MILSRSDTPFISKAMWWEGNKIQTSFYPKRILTRAQKDQGTPFSYSPFDPPSNKVPQIVEIIMLEYLRVPRNFLGLWPLRLRPSKLRLPGN